MVLVVELAAMVEEQRLFDGATTVTATVDQAFTPEDGDLTVPVHVRERLVQTRPVHNVPMPGPGDEVAVEVAADQPGIVRLAGSSYPGEVDLLWGIAPMLVCGLLAVGRHRFAGRVLRRAEEASAAFAVVGRIRGAAWSDRRPVLDVYSLDAGPGTAPLASVPLATTGGLPLEESFPAECKGVPRPYGLVVARTGDTVLWPSTPAVGGRSGAPRDGDIAAVTPLPPADRPPTASLEPLSARAGTWVLPGALLLVLVVVAISWHGVATDHDRLDSWPHFPATVVDAIGRDSDVLVEVSDGDDPRVVEVSIEDPGELSEGPGYEVMVDPSDPDHVLLVTSLYDPSTPLLLVGSLAVVAAWWFARTWERHRQASIVAAGPWATAVVERLPDATVLRAPGDRPGTVRTEVADVAPDGVFGPAVAAAMSVAGDVGPGAFFVAWWPGIDHLYEGSGSTRPRPRQRRQWRRRDAAR